MANVMFKRGLSTNLPTGSNIVDGAFYLTTDTNHLYIGKDVAGNKSLAKINGNIHSVASLPATGEAGEFYYLPGQNILAYYDNGKWVQLNPNTDTKLTKASITKNAEKSDNSKIVYDVTLGLKDINNQDLTPVTTELEINSADVTGIVTQTAVEVGASVANKVATIKTSGAGSAGTGFTITGGNNVTIGGSNNAITIDAVDTTYSLAPNGTKIELKNNSDAAVGAVEFVDDDKWVEVSNDNGKIKVAHIGSDSATENASSGNTKLKDEDTFKVITGLTIEKGHVTGYNTATYAVQDTTYTIDAELDSAKSVKISLKDENNVVADTAVVDISSKVKVNGQSYDIKPSGEITLPDYYTKSDIDNQHQAINAMVYKGIVDSEHPLPTEGVKIGWTYKVNEAGTYGGKVCQIGDLLIANGTETNGILSSITWDHIDTSDFEDTTYDLRVENNHIVLYNNVTTGKDEIFLNDDDVVILTAANDTIEAKHKGITITKPAATKSALTHSGEFTVITGLEDDKHGHITKINTTKFTLPASGDKVTADANNVKLTFKDVADAVQGSIDLNGSDVISVTGASTDNKNLVATIAHNTITKNNTTGTAQPKHNETFNVVESISYNDYGHVTGVKTTTVTLPTLPQETTYRIDGPESITKGVKYSLKNNSDDVKGTPIEIISNTLEVKASNSQTTVELVWGSF